MLLDYHDEEEYISSIIKSAISLPKRLQKIGAVQVGWWEGKPGDAVIMASGGTIADRVFAERIMQRQLEPFGYKRALFEFPQPLTEIPVDGGEAISVRPENRPGGGNKTPGWFRYKNGDVVVLQADVKGIAEGPENAQGVGEEVTVPAGSVGYVYEQNAGGGIEITFPLEGGANTPTHIYCNDVRPNEVVPGSNKNDLEDPMRGKPWGGDVPDRGGESDEKTRDLWGKLMEKARRLVESGAVTNLQNYPTYIQAAVRGDHGAYKIEIGKESAHSRVVTSWSCECDWSQYAWQRTRKWKKYEGRPCSHVLAVYWQAEMIPIKGEPEPAGGAGGRKMVPKDQLGKPAPQPAAPAVHPPGGGMGEASPFAEGPGTETGQIPKDIQGPRGLYQMRPPEDQENLIQKRFEQPRGIEPTELPTDQNVRSVIPESPVERQQRLVEEHEQRRNQFSDPRKALPSPTNPLQQMQVFTKAENKFDVGNIVHLIDSVMGLVDGDDNGGFYKEVPALQSDNNGQSMTKAEVCSIDDGSGLIECLIDFDGVKVRCFIDPKSIAQVNDDLEESSDWEDFVPSE
jgi:hypothetical protein